jgi:hypothetical protein
VEKTSSSLFYGTIPAFVGMTAKPITMASLGQGLEPPASYNTKQHSVAVLRIYQFKKRAGKYKPFVYESTAAEWR